MLMIGYKGKEKDAIKSRINSYLLFLMLRSEREFPYIYTLSLSKFKFPRILFACCLVTWAKRQNNTTCNRSYPKMLLGCKLFPALDGVRAFTWQ